MTCYTYHNRGKCKNLFKVIHWESPTIFFVIHFKVSFLYLKKHSLT